MSGLVLRTLRGKKTKAGASKPFSIPVDESLGLKQGDLVRDRLAGELDPIISEGVLPAMDAAGFKRCTFAPEPEMVTADAIMLMRIAVNRDNGIYFELNLVSSEYHTIAPLGVDA